MVEITPQFVIVISQYILIGVGFLPFDKNASNLKIILVNIFWWLFWFLSLSLAIPLAYTAYEMQSNLVVATKSLCLSLACLQCTIKMSIYKIHYPLIQFLVEEIDVYVSNATSAEKSILKQYAKRRGIVYVISFISGLIATITIVCGPLVLPQSLPTDAKYPFSVQEYPVYEIVYIQQIVAGLQCAFACIMEMQIAMVLWFLVGRLEYLGIEMSNIENESKLYTCIRKHQYLLWFITQVYGVTELFVLTTIIMSTISIILGSIHIVGNQPFMIKAQFVVIDVAFLNLLFLIAWPADYIISACESIGSKIYESEWIQWSGPSNKCIVMIVQRTGKPCAITFRGITPNLSLKYYASVLSTIFSYFTTLRSVIGDIEH
uniref:Odorant receptor n=1 Tax=Aulacocentrum confusum TaxID=2767324 RepID=A0A7G8Z974_9HYME|nr:olfactory receptor 55 [Aulacocentrum confusum]